MNFKVENPRVGCLILPRPPIFIKHLSDVGFLTAWTQLNIHFIIQK